MTNIHPFGEIDPHDLDECYDAQIEVNGDPIEIDLNFESKTIEVDILKKVSQSIDAVDVQIQKAFEALSADFDLGEESEAALFYLEHHLEQLSDDEILKIFGSTEITKELFLKKIAVSRIGFYPEDEESFVVVDLKLPDQYTNYIMAVTFDAEGELSFISMES
ncbi:MAG: DUF2004 domain-containing protein [Planctomycetaceae bacterium]|nr:DUF2004 domain-containing protein [Planctomycetaceae bacterium]